MSRSGDTFIDVLVVDDDEIDRLAVTRALAGSELPVRVEEVTRAEDGLDRLRDGRFACAIIDVRMPGHDGEWLLRALRSESIRTPVVVLTGHGDESTAVELMKAGASDYLSKADLSTERLAGSIRHALRVHAAEAQAREALEELQQSEQRLRVALEVAALGSFERNLQTGELRCDARCKELFGLAPDDEPDAERMSECIVPEDRELLNKLLQAACAPGSSGSYEATYRTRDLAGNERWLKTIAQVTFSDGRARTVVGTVKDVTERRRYEEQRSRQLSFEQELIGIVSHDLRNPIAAMMLSASSLLLRAQDDDVMRRGLVRIASSGERASRMVRDLLDFTRARMGGGIPIERALCDLHEIAASTFDEALAAFPERAITHESNGDGRGLWDGDRLAQVVMNLLGNALSYSPEDTRVVVRTFEDGADVVLEVQNEGEPIPAELLPSLFTPFRRGQPNGRARSVGLGLYIVSQIVIAHGGRHEIRSSEAEGTVFKVRLPRRDIRASDLAPAS